MGFTVGVLGVFVFGGVVKVGGGLLLVANSEGAFASCNFWYIGQIVFVLPAKWVIANMGDDVFAGGALSDAYLLFGTAQTVNVGDGFLFVVGTQIIKSGFCLDRGLWGRVFYVVLGGGLCQN